MRDIPIPFTGQMVRPVLADTKTKTRRVMRSQPYANGHTFDGHDIRCHIDALPPSAMLMDVKRGKQGYTASDAEGDLLLECPQGVPGDHLWVREAWRTDASDDAIPPREVRPGSPLWFEADGPDSGPKFPFIKGRRRPGMFMPRWASRITLEVVSVDFERLQSISEEDCYAEGVPHDRGDWPIFPHESKLSFQTDAHGNDVPATIGHKAIDVYRWIWTSINGATGPTSWDANPWVWIIEFKRL